MDFHCIKIVPKQPFFKAVEPYKHSSCNHVWFFVSDQAILLRLRFFEGDDFKPYRSGGPQ